MTGLRRLIHRNLFPAWCLLAAALAMKLLVPAGFMPMMDHGSVTVQICSGGQPVQLTMKVAPGTMHHGDHPAPAKTEMPCAFAGLAMPLLGGADPLLLAVLIAFVMALATRIAVLLPPRRAGYLRPPLRGPPTPA